MSPELKVLEKIRKILTDDSTIKSYVQDRVYTAHISSINKPEYPAISLHLMPGQARTNVPDMANILIQIDLWFPVKDYAIDDVMTCYQKVRDLLHRQNLTDASLSLTVGQIFESIIGPNMYDEDNQCHHLPARYAVVAI